MNRILTASVSVLGASLIAGAACADVTIISKVTVAHAVLPSSQSPVITFHSASAPAGGNEGAPAGAPSEPVPPVSESVTTYYKNDNARTEISGGLVTLYHGGEGKIYTLDPSQKTYYVESFDDILQPKAAAPQNPAITMKVDGDIDLSPGTDTRTVSGNTAKVFLVSGAVTVTPERTGGGSRGGSGGGGGRRRRGGGGGFPGGGGGGFPGGGGGFPGGGGGGYPGGGDGPGGDDRGAPASRVHIAPVQVSGEYWLADSVKLPSAKKASLLPAVYAPISGETFAFKPLAERLKKTREIPLGSRIAFTRTSPQGVQESVTMTTEVASVAQTALADSLFQLPIGYTEVAAPTPPSP
ncbi:hypothetical protein CCAX7_53270 [Capsulimonas corticalis]|uniref:Uncharacterized protein n=1 Tax=Capsulimonas corticalis TaxID=2219043 RepID=A0A402CNU0_9BACT|nr:hypothetical protein [Capsulimonas corticalis]BDI33276.1 hypothetical protein CCAX7_53270 [Capsulimonas corticalis]